MNPFLQFQTKEGQKRLVRMDQVTQISESATGKALVYTQGQSYPVATDTDYSVMVENLFLGMGQLTQSQADRLEQKVDSIIKCLGPVQLNYRSLEDYQKDISDARNENPVQPLMSYSTPAACSGSGLPWPYSAP